MRRPLSLWPPIAGWYQIITVKRSKLKISTQAFIKPGLFYVHYRPTTVVYLAAHHAVQSAIMQNKSRQYYTV